MNLKLVLKEEDKRGNFEQCSLPAVNIQILYGFCVWMA